MNPVLYILMRDDLPSMSVGQAMAQASHASNQMMFLAKSGNERQLELAQQWEKECVGFGTAIVLAASLRSIEIFGDCSKINGVDDDVLSGIVTDPTYAYKTTSDIANLIPDSVDAAPRLTRNGNTKLYRKEVTCGFVLLDKDKYPDFMSGFQLWK